MLENNTPLEQRTGDKLAELRMDREMTREKLAALVGVAPRHIAAIERSEKKPSLNALERIMRVLGAPTEWLIYPELHERNTKLDEITRMAATFTEEQQRLLFSFMHLMRDQKYGEEK